MPKEIEHIPPTEAELETTIKALTLALRNVVRRSGLCGYGSRGEKEVWLQDAEEALTKRGREDLLLAHDETKDNEIRRLRALCGRAEPFVRAWATNAPTLFHEEERIKFADELRAASEGRR